VLKWAYGVHGKEEFEDDVRQALAAPPPHT
jgi:hypothetical protein